MINAGEEMRGKPLMWLQKKSGRKAIINAGEEKGRKS